MVGPNCTNVIKRREAKGGSRPTNLKGTKMGPSNSSIGGQGSRSGAGGGRAKKPRATSRRGGAELGFEGGSIMEGLPLTGSQTVAGKRYKKIGSLWGK